METKVEARVTRREVIEMNPIGSRHADCVRNLNRILSRQVGDDLLVDVQNPIRPTSIGSRGRTLP